MRLLLPVTLLCLMLSQHATATQDFVTVTNGNFRIGKARWTPFGVMYTPLYAQPGVDQEPRDWMENYDPKPIDEDLDLMKSLGLNCVRLMDSEGYNNKHRSENWATYPTPQTSYKASFGDFLTRLGRRGMKAQFFLHYTPEGSRWIPSLFEFSADRRVREQSLALITKTIKDLALKDRPELLSYEVDWEPHVGGEQARNRADALKLWNRWIQDQYGSVANAEKSWGFVGDKMTVDGKEYVSAPTDEQVMNDGAWTRKSVAYRRFLIELINRKYAYLAHTIRTIDPNHLICAQRCAFLGKIPGHDDIILYPIRHTTAFLDYTGYTFSPHDTWGLFDENVYRNDPDRFRKQAFVIRYSKRGTKPVLFDEYGASTWYKQFPDQTAEHLELIQKLHYERMLQVGHEFGIDGALAWWWVGKRPMNKGDNEWSDWGIRRMDGTLKPCAEIVKRFAPSFQSLPAYRPTAKIVADEFAHACESDMYIRGKADFLAALQSGKLPEVVSPYDGTDSANCPLTRLDGSEGGTGPIRALDASLGVVEVLDGSGAWAPVSYGDTVKVASDKVKLRLTAANTGDAKWLRGGRDTKGAVVLAVKTPSSEREQAIPRDVPPDGTALLTTEVPVGDVTLQMRATGRADFGEVMRFRLVKG